MDKVRDVHDVWYIIKPDNHCYRLDTRDNAEKRKRAAKYFVCMSHACKAVDTSGQLTYYTNYRVYSNDFTPTKITAGNFECIEVLEKQLGKVTTLGFVISDKQGLQRHYWFSYSIKAFKECIQFMQEQLTDFSSWYEYDIHKLQIEIEMLREENKLLNKELVKFNSIKDNIKELYHLLHNSTER